MGLGFEGELRLGETTAFGGGYESFWSIQRSFVLEAQSRRWLGLPETLVEVEIRSKY